VSGALSFTGSGTITLGDHPSNRITQVVGGSVPTRSAGHTIRGSGLLLAGTGNMNNAGSIIADQTNARTSDPGLEDFNNTGTLRAPDRHRSSRPQQPVDRGHAGKRPAAKRRSCSGTADDPDDDVRHHCDLLDVPPPGDRLGSLTPVSTLR